MLGFLAAAIAAPSAASAEGRHRTRGVVKSFGKERRYVNIAHEEIPGYMAAMTMSFEPRRPEQLEGLAPGDRVALSFTDEGVRRLIDTIEKL